MKKITLILLAGSLTTLAAAGCTTNTYRRWADAQVGKIVTDREQRTLGYTPQVEVGNPADTKPAREAYAKIPDTPLPPPTTSPVEPGAPALPYGPLGPEMIFPTGVSAPQANGDYGLDTAIVARRLQLGPPAPGEPVVRLDLFGALKYAVLNSREYRARMEDLYLVGLNVTLQRHLFTPRPFAQTGLRYNGGQASVDYNAALTAFNALGLRQQLPYGGEVVVQAAVDFIQAVQGNAEDAERASVTLSGSIPLLRGAGLVNLEGLISSEREVVYEVRGFEDFRRTFALTIATDYFRLLSTQQAIANRAGQLVALQSLTARTQALYAAQRINYIDVQRALQEQLDAENQLINAQADYRAALDDFKLTLGMPIDQPLEIIAQELSVNIPEYPEEKVAELAVRYRLDVVTAQDRIEDAQRFVEIAKNNLLPDLDVQAQTEFANTPGTPGRNFNNDETAYSAAITLDLPLDRVAERNRYREALIRLERARREYNRLRDLVSAAARDSLRQIKSSQLSLEIQRQGIELARLRLENASELLRQGKSDSRDVVDAQNALLRAQDAFEQARADVQIQVLRFLRDTGTLRLDPEGGAIGAAMNRRAAQANPPARDPARPADESTGGVNAPPSPQ